MSPTLAVSPLSPERAWASQRNCRRRGGGADGRTDRLFRPLPVLAIFFFLPGPFIVSFPSASPALRPSACPPVRLDLQDLHPHLALDHPTIDQRGPVGHNLFDRRSPASKAGDAGRTGEHQRCNLPGEPLDRPSFAGADPDPELYLRRLRIRGTTQIPVGGVGADELGEHRVVL